MTQEGEYSSGSHTHTYTQWQRRGRDTSQLEAVWVGLFLFLCVFPGLFLFMLLSLRFERVWVGAWLGHLLAVTSTPGLCLTGSRAGSGLSASFHPACQGAAPSAVKSQLWAGHSAAGGHEPALTDSDPRRSPEHLQV